MPRKSKTQRWNNAVERMKNAADTLIELRDEMTETLNERKGDQTAMERERETVGWPEKIQTQMNLYEQARADLEEVQEEYSDWYINMPEALQDGSTGEKLAEIIELDFSAEPEFEFSIAEGAYSLEENFDELLKATETAENADLPLGFGRD